MPHKLIIHGGPDAQGVPLYDFSTNANACGPCPDALAAVQQADATRYPDPAYAALRDSLGAFHAVAPERIVLAASASECIHRFTALAALQGAQAVSVPRHSYGDYAQAAQARGLAVHHDRDGTGTAGLQWACEPSSPLGALDAQRAHWLLVPDSQLAPTQQPLRVLDCAYAPLRLDGSPPPAQAAGVWQLWTPNKALGLTGVRGAYAIAPEHALTEARALEQLAASWPLGAHAVAMLQAWTGADSQAWLAHSLPQLRQWTAELRHLLHSLGLAPEASVTPFLLARRPPAASAAALRASGLAVRDCRSFGLPGWMRLSAQPPEALAALGAALQALLPTDRSAADRHRDTGPAPTTPP